MIWDEPTPPRHHVDVLKAVAIAALSSLATALVTWGVEEIKTKVKTTKKKPEE
jgi:hypothetical protein